jgi:hypothetical protein
MKWVENVACMGGVRSEYKILVGNKEKRQYGN